MNKILLAISLFLCSTFTFAANATDMSANWVCTTNASSSDLEADKAADDTMAKNPVSAANAFGLASNNCRDCTKITCEVEE
jgi:hypothetical protein